MVQGQVEQLLQVERVSGGMWAHGDVGMWGHGHVEGERWLPAIVIGAAQTVFSRALTPVQKHCTPLPPSQAPCGLCWCNRGPVLGAGAAASGRGERDSARPRHPAVQMAGKER